MKQKLVPYEHGGEPTELHIDLVSEMLYVNKKVAGKRHKFSTGFKKDDYEKAKAMGRRELKERLEGKNKVRITRLITDELDSYYKVKLAEGLAEDTIKNVRNAIKQIRPYWGDKFPIEINTDNLPGWYSWFVVEYPEQQMENAIKYMRNFCRYLSEKVVDDQALLPAIPSIRDPNHKKVRRGRKKRKGRIFTPDEFEKNVFPTAKGLQEQVLAMFMYTMASRVTETLTLDFDEHIHMDLSPPIYRWVDDEVDGHNQNKADLDGWHALNPALIPLLKRLKKQRDAEGTSLLFPQKGDKTQPLKEQQIDWDEWRARAGLTWHWTSHTFRHTCLSNLFNDVRNPHALIIKLYRVSLAVALAVYVKPTLAGIMKMRDAIKVAL